MDTTLPLSTVFQLFAAFNAILLGAISLCRATLKASLALRLGGFALLLVAVVMIVISLDNAGITLEYLNLEFVESILTLAIGPLLLALVLAVPILVGRLTFLIGFEE